MRRSITNTLAIIIISMSFTACFNNSGYSNSNPTTVGATDQYIVVLNDSLVETNNNIDGVKQEVIRLLNSHYIPHNRIVTIYDNVIKGMCVKLNSDQLKELKADAMVKTIEKDRMITIKKQTDNNQKNGKFSAKSTISTNNVEVLSKSLAKSGVAWIVDTGIDLKHDGLNINTQLSKTFVTTGNDALTPEDMNGHGSQIAHNIGVAIELSGTELIAVKVLNYTGAGTISQIIKGLDYVKSNLRKGRVNVVNLSMGSGLSKVLDYAINNLASSGAKIIIESDVNNESVASFSPTSGVSDRVYVISANNNPNDFAYFSNYGWSAAKANQRMNVSKNATDDYFAPSVLLTLVSSPATPENFKDSNPVNTTNSNMANNSYVIPNK